MKNFLDNFTDKYRSYFNGIYVDKIKNLELATKTLLVTCGIQMIVILLMINYVIQASIYKEVNIIVNKENLIGDSKYTYEKSNASRSAFENSAYGIIHQITSFDFSTIESRSNWVLSMVHPDNYSEIYEELMKDSKFAIENRVSQSFRIKDWKYKQLNSSTAKITASGFLNREVGGISTIKGEPYEASVVISISNYTPFIVGIDLNYNGDKKEERKNRERKLNNFDKNEPKGMKDEKSN